MNIKAAYSQSWIRRIKKLIRSRRPKKEFLGLLVLEAWMSCGVTLEVKGKQCQWDGIIFFLLRTQSQGPCFGRQWLGKTANSSRLSYLTAQVSWACAPPNLFNEKENLSLSTGECGCVTLRPGLKCSNSCSFGAGDGTKWALITGLYLSLFFYLSDVTDMNMV